MAYTAPPTFVSGAALAAASLQALSDDITDLNSRTNPGSNVVATSQTTTSTSYTDLATVGPAVTIATGTAALVIVTASISTTGAGNSPFMGFAVSGASTIAAADAQALKCDAAGAVLLTMSAIFLVTGLTAGNNTFTAKYRVVGATGTWANRGIIVIPANKLA